MIDASMLLEVQLQAKRVQVLLREVMDISLQMIEAADRGDEITIQLLLSMRAEPLEKLVQTRKILEQQRDSLPKEDAKRLAQLLNGEPAATQQEEALAAQVSVNRKLLAQVVDCDRRLNKKITHEESVYEKNLCIDPNFG